MFGANPPILAFAPGDRDDGTPKDTARNIRLTHEFVVNLVDESIAEAMNKCAASLPYGENELSMPARLKKLNGAAFTLPSGLMVVTNAMGRG